MTYYIENIFICLVIPLLLSMMFRNKHMSAAFLQDITEQMKSRPLLRSRPPARRS